MPNLSRRGFIALTAAAGAARGLPYIGTSPKARWILTLVYDKAAGAMRAVERLVW